MKGETSASRLFPRLKVLPEAECTGRARVNPSLAPRGGVGVGAAELVPGSELFL